MTRSLRLRLLVGSLAATLAVFVVAAVVLYGTLRNALLTEYDAALDTKAHALVSVMEQNDYGIKIDLESGQMPEFNRSIHPDYFIVTDHTGKVAVKSASFVHTPWPITVANDLQRPVHTFVTLPDQRRGRMVQFAFLLPREDDERPAIASQPWVITVVCDVGKLDEQLKQLIWVLGGVFGLAILLSAGAMAVVVGQGLRPLSMLAERIRAIGTADLSERVRLEQSPTEMVVVVQRLNELLAKVDANLKRERAFTADVAHELRTPLAGLMTAIQVCLAQRRGPEDYQSVLAKCLGVTGSMRMMVENLLALARADAEQVQCTCLAVDLIDLLHQQWLIFEERCRERGLALRWTTPEHLAIKTDPGLLATVIRNLFDNAVSYCDAGGAIHIEVGSQAASVILRITNTGSQVAAEDAGLVFQRFWRGDAARTVSGHCGLGLALCQRIVRLLGGAIEAQSTAGGTFVVEIRLPLS